MYVGVLELFRNLHLCGGRLRSYPCHVLLLTLLPLRASSDTAFTNRPNFVDRGAALPAPLQLLSKDRRNSGFRSTYFRIRVSGSKVVISGEIRVPKSAFNWLKIADMKAISTQKQHEDGNSEYSEFLNAPGLIRAPTGWVEIWV